MSKRKAAVNDIIYELDNDDIEISSEDEAKEAKIQRSDKNTNTTEKNPKSLIQQEVVIIDEVPKQKEIPPLKPTMPHIGGKTSDNALPTNKITQSSDSSNFDETDYEPYSEVSNSTSGAHNATIYHEDIVVDSPASNIDLGVVGCENRTPLITVKFRDKKIAANYKRKLKTFMLNLIKLHEVDLSPDIESETDIELDIWPEDLDDVEQVAEEKEEDNLFFVDTAPCLNSFEEIPAYSQVSSVITNKCEEEPVPPTFRRGPICFNCDGPHMIRECTEPRNSARIAEKRKAMTKMGRYHVEDEQKYGHLIPGRISGQLRYALGLKRNEIPLYIYRMRLLGYPPGWLEEARISHSGITMFDSSGAAIMDPEEEEGEVCEPGCKDKFDIKKILDFPGFNVPASSRYIEESHLLGTPPMSEQDSKIAMLQMLAPNAMKAYKRKKLTLFPSASISTITHEAAEMELDSGDEVAVFPSVPPLPDEAPPPPPPPPPQAPPSPPPEPFEDLKVSPPLPPDDPPESPLPTPDISINSQDNSVLSELPSEGLITSSPLRSQDTNNLSPFSSQDVPSSPLLSNAPKTPPRSDITDSEPQNPESAPDQSLNDDLLVVEVLKVKDIPVPEIETINIDEEEELPISGRVSPSLNDLEEKKRLLLSALGEDVTSINSMDAAVESTDNKAHDAKDNEEDKPEEQNIETVGESIDSSVADESKLSTRNVSLNEKVAADVSPPESKAGKVKTTLYGTPVLNIVSPFMKLPSDDKFAKDICDVINFENLPNSTGKYKKICSLLKKVKSEVDRIQDS